MNSGIYAIINIETNAKYIGQAFDVLARIKDHKLRLKRGADVKYLQAAYDKYGEDKFKYEVLEYCEKDKLDILEQQYIKQFKSNIKPYGYNLTSGGQGSRHLVWTEESRKKLSESRKGKPLSNETKQKLSSIMKGNRHFMNREQTWSKGLTKETDERLKKLGEKVSNTCKNRSEEEKLRLHNKQSKSQRKRFDTQIVSEDTRNKMSKAHKGKLKNYVFIYKDGKQKMVPPDELETYVNNDWVEIRKCKSIKLIKDNKIKQTKECFLEKYLLQGYSILQEKNKMNFK